MKMKGILCKSCVEKNIFLKNYEEVKDEKMEIICKEIHEDPIIEKVHEIEIVEAIKQDHFKINSEGKLTTHKSDNPIDFANNKVLQYIDFIGLLIGSSTLIW